MKPVLVDRSSALLNFKCYLDINCGPWELTPEAFISFSKVTTSEKKVGFLLIEVFSKLFNP